ncbi:MAG: Fur family transcriptional regulator [Pseudomonadota bacterium]
MGPHDHAECIAGVLREAEAAIVASGARLTPVRRRVLEILLESHTALGAYEILKRLSAEGFGDKPPVVYRALDFLREHRLAHKIERLNAFVACMHPAADHVPAFMICRDCRAVAETTSPAPLLAGDAAEIGFKIETTMVEAEGLCPKCQPK